MQPSFDSGTVDVVVDSVEVELDSVVTLVDTVDFDSLVDDELELPLEHEPSMKAPVATTAAKLTALQQFIEDLHLPAVAGKGADRVDAQNMVEATEGDPRPQAH